MTFRNFQIGFKVSKEEKQKIEQCAKKRGMPVSTYLRWLVFSSEKGIENDVR